MKALLKTLTITLTLLATACGWHLRGALILPPDLQSMYISASDGYSGIAAELKRTLEANDIEVAQSSSQAQMTMHIIEERNDRRTASVSSGGLASEYELSMNVTYKITDSNNNILVPEKTATVIRSYNFDPNSVTSAAQEEQILRQEMRSDVIQQMARALRFMQPAATAPNTLETDASSAVVDSASEIKADVTQ